MEGGRGGGNMAMAPTSVALLIFSIFVTSIVGALEDNPDMNSSYIPEYLDQEVFMREMTRYTYWYLGELETPLIARFMGPTRGPPEADRTQVGPMWAA